MVKVGVFFAVKSAIIQEKNCHSGVWVHVSKHEIARLKACRDDIACLRNKRAK